MQGYGYVFHAAGTYGPRLLRLYEVVGFSVHDFALVDSPAFHFTMDTCSNGEVYNMIIRGGNEGGLDGIDVWGTNIHIHDVEVTNKDECVTVKVSSYVGLHESLLIHLVEPSKLYVDRVHFLQLEWRVRSRFSRSWDRYAVSNSNN